MGFLIFTEFGRFCSKIKANWSVQLEFRKNLYVYLFWRMTSVCKYKMDPTISSTLKGLHDMTTAMYINLIFPMYTKFQ